jgi:hypothetical protein
VRWEIVRPVGPHCGGQQLRAGAGLEVVRDKRRLWCTDFCQWGTTAVSWLSLSKATIILDHDVQRAQESLGRAISKAWIVGAGGSPAPATDPNVPLRVRVTPSPGWRLVGRDWLGPPVLHWETSEIECLCTPWMPPRASQPVAPSQSRAKIEVWREDIGRLWGGPEIPSADAPSSGSASTSDELMQENGPAGVTSDLDPDA